MAKEKQATAATFFRELFQLGVYKRSQGRIARQVTAAILGIIVILGAWRLHAYMINFEAPVQLAVPTVLLLASLWIVYRLVNLPSFADFLIAVEAEMNKVSWPTRTELFRSSVVVILMIFFLAFILFGYDLFWKWLLYVIGVSS